MATLVLSYEDGSEASIPIKPRGLIAAERKFGKDFPPLEATFFAAWVQAGKPSTFDEWLDTIAEFREESDPTKRATSESVLPD